MGPCRARPGAASNRMVDADGVGPWSAPPGAAAGGGGGEDGARTSQLRAKPEAVDRLGSALAAWEARHPPTPPTSSSSPVPDLIQDQLQALGYVESG